MFCILQADGDQHFCQEVEAYFNRLNDTCYVRVERGESLLATINEVKPSVVLLDLDLQPQGGLALLREIRSCWKEDRLTVIVCASKVQDEDILQKTADLGADYFILRPVDLVVLEQRLRQLTCEGTIARAVTLRQVQEICVRYFELLGVPPHYKGYRYLIEGIWLASLHPTWLNSVTQNLYPAIGQRFSTNGSQVERAMRYALDVTWEKGNVNQLYQFFAYEVRENKGKPTNSMFIAKMVDLVALEIGRHG